MYLYVTHDNSIIFWNIAISGYFKKLISLSTREMLYPRNVNFALIREI